MTKAQELVKDVEYLLDNAPEDIPNKLRSVIPDIQIEAYDKGMASALSTTKEVLADKMSSYLEQEAEEVG